MQTKLHLQVPDDRLILLPLTYFGPVQYYSKFLLDGRIVIEQYDSYSKQTYRNRCVISGANGPVILTIPVKKKRGRKNLVKDIIIDYDTDWRRLHWRGIISAYNSSPFFEFFRDNIEPFYFKKYIFLVDYCYTITREILHLLNIPDISVLSNQYLFPGDNRIIFDFRDLIHPKINYREDDSFNPIIYQQVFSDKQAFLPNLSILDLLFNLGPEATTNLRKSLISD
jgi:hypothetical protein